MTFPSFTRFTVSAALAIFAGLAGFSASPAVAVTCTTPVLTALIDPAASGRLSPRIILTAVNLSLPAQGRFEWGDGQHGVARMSDGTGGLDVDTTIQPTYGAPGTYNLSLAVTDACGVITTLPYRVTVPMILPTPASVTCPGLVDTMGYCVIALGTEATFGVSGGPADTAWQWSDDSARNGRVTETGVRLRSDTGLLRLQASNVTQTGWLVTPILDVVAVAPPRPRITAFLDVGAVTADRPFDVGFALPSGSMDGTPSIYVDELLVADAITATISLARGSHTVAYVVTYPDGGVIQRQTLVLANADGMPFLIAASAAVVLLALALLTFALHRQRSGGPSAVARDTAGVGPIHAEPRGIHS
jgi:hypothetical protein